MTSFRLKAAPTPGMMGLPTRRGTMSQHTRLDSAPEQPTDRPSEPPEPTQSERRLRSSTTSSVPAPSVTGALERISRPSVRPSAFGAPRANSRSSVPPAKPSAPAPPATPVSPEALNTKSRAAGGAIGDHPSAERDADYDADTSPGLIVSALASPIHQDFSAESDSLPPASALPPRNPAAALQRSVLPVARPITTPGASSSGGPPLQLVLSRTSLPDAPPAMLAPVQPAQGRPEEPRRAATSSIAIFAAMLCAAGVPLARYALGSERATSNAMPRAAASPPLQRLAAMGARAAQPIGAAQAAATSESPAPSAQPLAPSPPVTTTSHKRPHARADRLAEIMSSLPAETEPASKYLLDHAVRAKDSGQSQLAETLLGRASELDDRNPHPAYELAKLRFEQGNFEGAEGWIANAIRLRPRRAEYRALYAQVLTRLGREREARDERRRAKRYAD